MHTSMKGNRMFSVIKIMKPKVSLCLQTNITSEKEAYMWHSRFGHLNHQGLRTLSCKNMLIDLPLVKTPDTIYTNCLTGKQHRELIPQNSVQRASKVLQWLHADICGPIKPTSSSNKRYVLALIDDLTRKTWCYLLHEKSKVFK